MHAICVNRHFSPEARPFTGWRPLRVSPVEWIGFVINVARADRPTVPRIATEPFRCTSTVRAGPRRVEDGTGGSTGDGGPATYTHLATVVVLVGRWFRCGSVGRSGRLSRVVVSAWQPVVRHDGASAGSGRAPADLDDCSQARADTIRYASCRISRRPNRDMAGISSREPILRRVRRDAQRPH